MNRLVERFLFELQGDVLEPRYNIAPSQPVAIVRQPSATGSRQLAMLKWGLVPSWAQDPAIGYKLINARSETIATKPSFRSAFKNRRCLVLTDGYFEWRRGSSPKRKQPYYIRMQDDRPFALAGLWETWQAPDGSPLESCTIVTTVANAVTRPIHHRMPVILGGNDYECWLVAPATDAECLLHDRGSYPSDEMELFPVSTLVNSPKNQTPLCIQPLNGPDDETAGPSQLSLF